MVRLFVIYFDCYKVSLTAHFQVDILSLRSSELEMMKLIGSLEVDVSEVQRQTPDEMDRLQQDLAAAQYYEMQRQNIHPDEL